MEMHLGPYKLIRRLGRGGMAEVVLAWRQGSGGFRRKVVVKCLHEHLCGSPEAEGRFVEEAILGSQLDHNQVVKVLDLGVSGGRMYMAMEYVEGLDLRTLLKRSGPLTAEVVLYIGREVSKALQYAHTLSDERGRPFGIVHRDVSPSNILLSRTGDVKLADFGVAKAVGREATRSGVIKGKYAYMSPEQVDQGALGPTSDLFSLGSVLYEAATRERLFKGKGPLEILNRVRSAERVSWSEGLLRENPGLGGVLERALEREWTRRYSSAREMGLEMAQILASSGHLAPFEALGRVVSGALEETALSRDELSDDQATNDYLIALELEDVSVLDTPRGDAFEDDTSDSVNEITSSYDMGAGRGR